jgi:outer membrane protein
MDKPTLAAAIAATALATPAFAQSTDGHWQVKLLASGVLPDGKIVGLEKNAVGIPVTSQTKVNDNVVPTPAIEYYATPNVSFETICCLTQHRASGVGAIGGTDIIDHILILPATLTLKYHIDAGAIRPYVGVGPSMFLIFGEKPGVTAQALGVTRVRMSNKVGIALQAGADVPVNDGGMGISLDAKKYFIDPTAHFYTVTGVEALTTSHSLDPWVVSGGVYLRF